MTNRSMLDEAHDKPVNLLPLYSYVLVTIDSRGVADVSALEARGGGMHVNLQAG